MHRTGRPGVGVFFRLSSNAPLHPRKVSAGHVPPTGGDPAKTHRTQGFPHSREGSEPQRSRRSTRAAHPERDAIVLRGRLFRHEYPEIEDCEVTHTVSGCSSGVSNRPRGIPRYVAGAMSPVGGHRKVGPVWCRTPTPGETDDRDLECLSQQLQRPPADSGYGQCTAHRHRHLTGPFARREDDSPEKGLRPRRFGRRDGVCLCGRSARLCPSHQRLLAAPASDQSLEGGKRTETKHLPLQRVR